jgi:hypothetical protein
MADAETLIVDCTTGEHTRRALSPAEIAQRDTDQAESQRIQEEDEQLAQRRQDILTKIAEAAGITVEELMLALPHRG